MFISSTLEPFPIFPRSRGLESELQTPLGRGVRSDGLLRSHHHRLQTMIVLALVASGSTILCETHDPEHERFLVGDSTQSSMRALSWNG